MFVGVKSPRGAEQCHCSRQGDRLALSTTTCLSASSLPTSPTARFFPLPTSFCLQALPSRLIPAHSSDLLSSRKPFQNLPPSTPPRCPPPYKAGSVPNSFPFYSLLHPILYCSSNLSFLSTVVSAFLDKCQMLQRHCHSISIVCSTSNTPSPQPLVQSQAQEWTISSSLRSACCQLAARAGPPGHPCREME